MSLVILLLMQIRKIDCSLVCLSGQHPLRIVYKSYIMSRTYHLSGSTYFRFPHFAHFIFVI